MAQVRRLITWALSGLAVGVAARALASSRATGAPLPDADGGPAPLFAAGESASRPERPPAATSDHRARFAATLASIRATLSRLRLHTTTIIAGSVAYYGMLAVFPAAIAAISLYGLIADPATLADQIESLAERLPEATADLISAQLTEIVNTSGTGLGFGAALGILAAIWSASAAARVLITGVNLAYDEEETRSFFVLRGLALLLTVGIIVAVLGVVGVVAVLPTFIDNAMAELVRWPALVIVVVGGLAALYRIAPANARTRHHPYWPGAFAAAILWLTATAVFSAAVTAFGRFNATYGALAGVVVLLTWFFISGLIVLLGAELNEVIEERRAAAPSLRRPA